MTKEQVFSLIRHILSAVGGILVGKGLLDDSTLTTIVGAVIALVGLIWSIIDHTYTLGSVEGVVRQILTALGGFLVFKGIIKPEQVETWVAVILALLPIILGQTDKLWANATPKSGAAAKSSGSTA